ncbi:MAG: tRNA-intron lyase [Candidatus Micrarchaeota archaeon]|nr:tRNA-intron lyase [Candidatus Micrarchaeota archaeon]
MALELIFDRKAGQVFAEDPSTKDILRQSSFGNVVKGRLLLRPEEALYALDVRKGVCRDMDGREARFNEVAGLLGARKAMARYFTYKDWRDRGLVIRYPEDERAKGARPQHTKRYDSSQIRLKGHKLNGTFYAGDLITVVDDQEKARKLYQSLWFGQYGTYKLQDHGTMCKLDVYETVFLIENGVLEVANSSKARISRAAEGRRHDFQKLYDVYSDWRGKGYVIKTGFKFGTHFRLYFPGAQPVKDAKWAHSMHVIQVFPRDAKLLIAEWSRAIRVAHSVRKTFILAIPGKSRQKKLDMDFVLYHRKQGGIETPGDSAPKYGMLSLSEDEYIGGAELSAIINRAKDERMELIVAIADRETAVTYYRIRRIELQGSGYEYYEIDWMQP